MTSRSQRSVNRSIVGSLTSIQGNCVPSLHLVSKGSCRSGLDSSSIIIHRRFRLIVCLLSTPLPDFLKIGLSRRVRTSDPLSPGQVRYQTSPCSDIYLLIFTIFIPDLSSFILCESSSINSPLCIAEWQFLHNMIHDCISFFSLSHAHP